MKGQVLFNEGNSARGLYIVNSGKVKVTKHGSDGKEQILKIVKENDFIGYKGLLTNEKCSVSAIVTSDADLLFIPKEEFLNFIIEDTIIANYFTQLLCADLNLMEAKLVSQAYKPVRGRLAETLLSLNKTYQNSITLSRLELANMIGTAKETVIRLLSEFKNEHLIETNGKWISVIDTNGIEKINNLYN
jgi:CRP-like cAMP-binding protein